MWRVSFGDGSQLKMIGKHGSITKIGPEALDADKSNSSLGQDALEMNETLHCTSMLTDTDTNTDMDTDKDIVTEIDACAVANQKHETQHESLAS